MYLCIITMHLYMCIMEIYALSAIVEYVVQQVPRVTKFPYDTLSELMMCRSQTLYVFWITNGRWDTCIISLASLHVKQEGVALVGRILTKFISL